MAQLIREIGEVEAPPHFSLSLHSQMQVQRIGQFIKKVGEREAKKMNKREQVLTSKHCQALMRIQIVTKLLYLPSYSSGVATGIGSKFVVYLSINYFYFNLNEIIHKLPR